MLWLELSKSEKHKEVKNKKEVYEEVNVYRNEWYYLKKFVLISLIRAQYFIRHKEKSIDFFVELRSLKKAKWYSQAKTRCWHDD